MNDYQLSLLYGIILEIFGIISLMINILSIFRMFNGDYLKQSAACIFASAVLTNAIFSLLFVSIIGPTFIFNRFFYADFIYKILDAFGCALWNLGGLLSATMAIERLAVLVLPQFSLLFKNGPLMVVIGVEILYSFINWIFICQYETTIKSTINIESFELSFPREFNYIDHSVCASVGLSIDFTVTLICIICYLMVYWKLKKMNNASGCLLSERAKYKRKQKEIKVAIDFFISTIVYIVFWVTARLIKPLIIPSETNRTFFAGLILLQIIHATIMSLTSIVFFKEAVNGSKQTKKFCPEKFVKSLNLRKSSQTTVAPLPTINNTI